MNLTEEQLEVIVVDSILKYLNNSRFDDVYIENNFSSAIIVAIEEMKEQLKQPSNLSSLTEGSRSVTFKNVGIGTLSDNVKSLLPKPYIRMW